MEGTAASHAEAHGQGAAGSCANCASLLQGPWCHACGQHSHDFHRSAWHLVLEYCEGLFHFDSRLWRTLPGLLLHPAGLTRDYVDGHRMSQIPPLRLVLVVLLMLFLLAPMAIHSGAPERQTSASDKASAQDPFAVARADITEDPTTSAEDKAAALLALERARTIASLARGMGSGAGAQGAAQQDVALPHVASRLFDHEFKGAEAWADRHLNEARRHPEAFRQVIEAWSERFAFMLLPMAALLLSLLFAFSREFWVFDHLIFAMHSLAFQGVLLVLGVLGSLCTLPGELGWILLLASPLHLFFHMRGFYRLRTSGTLVRMVLLGAGSLVGGLVLALGLVAVGLAGVIPA